MRPLLFGLMFTPLMGSLALAQPCARGALVAEVTYVRDGDTIELGGVAIRFEGIAAPEWDESGGAEATEAIEALVLGKEGSMRADREANVRSLRRGLLSQ